MRKTLTFGLAIGLMLGAVSGVRAEPAIDEPHDVAFASAGLGAGSNGLGGVLSLGFSRHGVFYGLRTATTTEFEIFGPTPALNDTDYAFLVGKFSGRRHSFTSAAAGIAVVHSVRRGAQIEAPYWFFGGTHERIDRVTVGLPLDLRATANLVGVGVGVNLFANLNPAGSFAGLALTLQVGKLR
ncbi:MAG TPA: hypothetical protein VGQ78_02585 [Vicinamibacteria bacterium]|jgi:hypothetical protein|nr:hypothetical protein [Vicinamibacteria bacterium]